MTDEPWRGPSGTPHRCGWMCRHGVRFQPSLFGHFGGRTNAFFMGGGKALNAYYRSAEANWGGGATTRRWKG